MYKYQLRKKNNEVIFGTIEECGFMHAVTSIMDIALEMEAEVISVAKID